MNIILTSACNKNCYNCFAADHMATVPPDRTHMPLAYLRSLLAMISPEERIRILGGEPTIHPQFPDVLGMCRQRRQNMVLITNLLCSDAVVADILDCYEDGYVFNILANAAELDGQTERMDRFAHNYLRLFSFLYRHNLETKLSCSLAIHPDKSPGYYLDYLDFLLGRIKKIEILRLSMLLPGSQTRRDEFDFIHNHTLGDTFYELTRKALNLGIYPHIDCQIMPCIFRNKEQLKLFMILIPGGNYYSCPGMPADTFADGSVLYCYPLGDAIRTQLGPDTDITSACHALKKRYHGIKAAIALPKQCAGCMFHAGGICTGPCLAYYSGEEIRKTAE